MDVAYHSTRAAVAGVGSNDVRHIAYIVQNPPSERDYRRFGISGLAERNIDAVVIDVSAYLHPRLTTWRAAPPPSTRIELHAAATLEQLQALSSRLSAADFIVCLVGFDSSAQSRHVYRVVTAARRPYVVLANNLHPGSERSTAARPRERFKDAWIRLRSGELKILMSLCRRLPNWMSGIRPPALIVYGGTASRIGARMYPVDETTKEIFAHSTDYEVFREISSRDAGAQPIAVFVDECVGRDQDFLALGIDYPVSPERYYPLLRRLFDRIEGETGLRVVIAANPRADYSDDPELFGRRDIERASTASSIARARLVIGHRSTALGWAVMFNKPIALVALREQHGHWTQRSAMDAFSKILRTPVRFFDDPATTDFSSLLVSSAEGYADYMERYVKARGSASEAIWDMIPREMARILGTDGRMP